MALRMEPIRLLEATRPDIWAADEVDFLRQLGGPVLIRLPGRDHSRCRALCTLLHGNEPSGVRALHRLLRQGVVPAVDLLCFVLGVETALHERPFHHRYLPGERDQNRCFRPPFDDRPGEIARRMLQLLESYRPECLIDIHNTSGAGPAFGVVVREDHRHEALVALFTHHLVVTDLQLGALMELSQPHCPMVTVECGGAGDRRADQLAWEGMMRYAQQDQVLNLERDSVLELYHNPVRLELASGARLAFASRPVAAADLTVPPDLERFNFGTAPRGSFIGWVGSPAAAERLSARDGAGRNRLGDWFCIDRGRLLTTRPLKLFMITHRVEIALGDCLLYAAPASGDPEGCPRTA